MTTRLNFVVDNFPGARLDRYLAGECQLSRSYVQKLIAAGQVDVNGQPVKASQALVAGDRVTVILPPPPTSHLKPEDIPLNIVYEDSDLLVLDKPAGLVVHPAPGHQGGTLVNALLAHCPQIEDIGGSVRPGIVHRLDKNTSGLMVVAKSAAAQTGLARQIKERSITKAYLALVRGHLSPRQGAIEAPIGRHPGERKRMAVVNGGREARTGYRVIDYLDDYTLVEALPETGRTHQIRVHFAAIDHPIFGDQVYGKRSPLLGRHFLHAHRLGFRLPSSGEYMEFTSELPPELAGTLELMQGGQDKSPGKGS